MKGAKTESEAVRMLRHGGEVSSEKVLRPLLVDWNNGRAGMSRTLHLYGQGLTAGSASPWR